MTSDTLRTSFTLFASSIAFEPKTHQSLDERAKASKKEDILVSSLFWNKFLEYLLFKFNVHCLWSFFGFFNLKCDLVTDT